MHIGKTGVSMIQKSGYWSFKCIVDHQGILINKTIFREVCYVEGLVRLTPHTFPVCKLEVPSRQCWLPVMSCNGLKCVCRSEVPFHLSDIRQHSPPSSSSRLSWQWPEATHSSAQSLTSPSSYQRNLINTEILGLPPCNNLYIITNIQ